MHNIILKKYMMIFYSVLLLVTVVFARIPDEDYKSIYDSLLNKANENISIYQYDSAVVEAEKALEIARERFGISEQCEARLLMGIAYMEMLQYPKALDAYEENLKICKKIEDKIGLMNALRYRAIVFWRRGMLAEALESNIKALMVADSIGYQEEMTALLNNIGIIYMDARKYKDALSYFEKALDKAQKDNDLRRVGALYNNIGLIYKYLEDYTNALANFKKSIRVKEKYNNKKSIANTLNNIGELYYITGEYNKALVFLNKALLLEKRTGNRTGLAGSYTQIGKIYFKKKQFEKAVDNLEKAVGYALEGDSKMILKEDYQYIAYCYYEMKKFRTAYDYHINYCMIKDELLNEKNAKEISQLEFKYRTHKKVKELELINKNAKIKELSYRRNIYILISFVLFVFLVTAIIAFLYWRHKINTRIAREKLESNLRLKADFTAMLVHDLRGPLTAIIGSTDVIALMDSDKQVMEIAENIKIASQKMLKLVNEMLDLSKIESGKMEILPRPSSPEVVVESSVKMLSALADDKSIKIITKIQKDIPQINIDPRRIEQVIANLLGNAIKFSPEKSVIFIRLETLNINGVFYLEFSIKDEGVGIDPAMKDVIFDQYAQIKNHEVSGGSGLGLAISKHIIQAHKGEIGYRAAKPTGTIFYFRIPY